MSETPPTRFAAALAEYGLDKCLMNATTLRVGADGSRDWPVFSRVPPNPPPRRIVEFVGAPEQAGLVAAFVASPEALLVEELLIGTSPDWPVAGFDMRAAVAALGGARLPRLRALDLGDMLNLYGGFRQFGTVGDIGHVFAAAPGLERLGIYGNFVLSAPVRHASLEVLETQFDDIGVTGEPIAQATLDALLLSAFPRLHTLHLDMDEGGGDETLTLPEGFASVEHLPPVLPATR